MALGRDRWGTDNHHAAGSAVIAYLNRVTRPLISKYVLERLPSGIKKGTIIEPFLLPAQERSRIGDLSFRPDVTAYDWTENRRVRSYESPAFRAAGLGSSC